MAKAKSNTKAKSKPGQKPVGEAPTPTPQAERSIAVTSEKKLRALLKDGRACRNAVQEANGTFGQKVSNAVENDHLHKKAFGVIRMLDKMEAEKLAEFMDHFDHYYTVSGLEERANSAQRLSFGAGEQAQEDEEDDDEQETAAGVNDENVRAFPAPQRVAAE